MEDDNIPSPKGLPLVGNLLDIQGEVPIQGLERMIDEFGPIVRIRELGSETILIGSVSLLEEISDEARFWKTPPKSLSGLRPGPKGLFAAESEDAADWQIAHRTLMPAFGPLTIQNMFDEMYDIASQLVLKIARFGPDHSMSPTVDFTKLTLDTIALCAMGYRFNSFYQDEPHPFVKAMNNSLATASDASKLGSILKRLLPWDQTAQHARADGLYMLKVGQELVQYRRENPTDKMDLLNTMIKGKDPKAGKMSDGLISANMVSFLVAGHETTSGLLSFAFLLLLQHPEAYRKVQEEVDRVVGREKLSVGHLKRLDYINAVLRETLRLHPTAPAYIRSIRSNNKSDTEHLAGGKYTISRSDRLVCLSGRIQRDPTVYDDPDAFRPERMMEENFKKLPKSAWKPFGTGVRSCIGRPFAWQEAQICIALLFQHLDFKLENPAYKTKIKQMLTVKPDGLLMKSKSRHGATSTAIQASLFPSADLSPAPANIQEKAIDLSVDSPGLTILYGSMTGTCKSVAQRLAMLVQRKGGRCNIVQLDHAVRKLQPRQPIVIISPSYEGEPPDNAKQFLEWLQAQACTKSLQGMSYAVFGCGHSDWKDTFHRVPKLLDDLMSESAATRIAPARMVDIAVDDVLEEAESWFDATLWPATGQKGAERTENPPALDIKIQESERIKLLDMDGGKSMVTQARSLCAAGGPEKRHMEVHLPDGMSYKTGDYLKVLPLQPTHRVREVCKRFGIAGDASITLTGQVMGGLPLNRPISLTHLLEEYFELTAPATKAAVTLCIDRCRSSKEKQQLENLCKPSSAKYHGSILSVISQFPSIDLSLAEFLGMLPLLSPRYYSISSSSLKSESLCSITYNVEEHADGEKITKGVAGEYLARLSVGDSLLVALDASNRNFRLPVDLRKTPIVMICAGTGLAPFHGFLQERAVQHAEGQALAPALLFVGCRSDSDDRLYGDEIDEWAREGIVEVKYAFSRSPSKSAGCRYVQERFRREQDQVECLWRAGAIVYTCSSRPVRRALAATTSQMLQASHDMTPEEAEMWLREQRNTRIVVESFG